MGPLEVLVISFPGTRFKAEVMETLVSAVENGTIRIVDITFLHKDASGTVTSHELNELDEADAAPFDIVDETMGLLSVVDLEKIGARLEPDSCAALIVVEHPWAATFDCAVRDANGRVVVREHIPDEVARAAVADAESATD
jgi:hypothetical protein